MKAEDKETMHHAGRTGKRAAYDRVVRGSLHPGATVRTLKILTHARRISLAESLRRTVYPRVPRVVFPRFVEPCFVHCVGDSHTRAFQIARRYTKRTLITTTIVRGASARGIGSSQSQTGARSQFLRTLEKVPQTHAVLVCMGEVDVGHLLWRLARDRDQDIQELMETSITRLMDFVSMLERRPVIIAGVTPPTVVDYRLVRGGNRLRSELLIPWQERSDLAKSWNTELRSWCEDAGHIYLDCYDMAVDQTTGRVSELFAPVDPADHHLNHVSLGEYLGSEALPAALRKWHI